MGSSLKFQAKDSEAVPAEGPDLEAASAVDFEEVGESGTIGARFEGWLWSILEVGRLKWPSGNPCDSIKFARCAPWVGMLPPEPEALPTQSIYLATLVRGRGTILKYI